MKTLFIDTHYMDVVIILFIDGKIANQKIIKGVSKQSEVVLPTIKLLIHELNINIRDVNEILVVNGPGSFTGVRIGVTIAKTIAYCLNIPIKQVNSLFLKACSISGNKCVGDLEKNGIYIGKFDEFNNQIGDLSYISLKEYNNLKSEIIVDAIIDYEKVYDNTKGIPYTNPHIINPIYVKKIEALK